MHTDKLLLSRKKWAPLWDRRLADWVTYNGKLTISWNSWSEFRQWSRRAPETGKLCSNLTRAEMIRRTSRKMWHWKRLISDGKIFGSILIQMLDRISYLRLTFWKRNFSSLQKHRNSTGRFLRCLWFQVSTGLQNVASTPLIHPWMKLRNESWISRSGGPRSA